MEQSEAMMSNESVVSRRSMLRGMSLAALSPALRPLAAIAQQHATAWWLGDGMPQESANTPKIACAIDLRKGVTDEAMRRVLQLGVNYVLSGGPPIPWSESQLQPLIDKLKAGGVTLGSLMIGGFPKTIYGQPGRDEEIEKVRQSIEVAGKVGLPVVEYNFYAHRAMEGYFEEIDKDRGNSGWTGFNYELEQSASQQYQTRPEEKGMKFKDLPPLANE